MYSYCLYVMNGNSGGFTQEKGGLKEHLGSGIPSDCVPFSILLIPKKKLCAG